MLRTLFHIKAPRALALAWGVGLSLFLAAAVSAPSFGASEAQDRIHVVVLHTNDIHGTMPIEVCLLRGPHGLKVLDADCNPTSGTGVPMVECMVGCCSACCDRVTGLCFEEAEP